MKHLIRLHRAHYYGFGWRYVALCIPCRWEGPRREDKADANEDYRRHQEQA